MAGRARPSELAAARQALGLSVEEAATRTRIPQRYLEALEKGDLSVFPPGPFLAGYTRQYRTFLQLPPGSPPAPAAPPEVTVTEPARPGRKSRSNALRLATIGGLGLAAIVLAAAIGERLLAPADVGPGVAPDQVVTVKSPVPIRARVTADDRVAFDGELPPGETRTFSAHDELAIELETLDQVQLSYNGAGLKPLGATSRARRLVFVDDTRSP